MPTVELEFPSKSVYVGVARLAVSGIARAAGFDEDTVFDLKTAVSEALSTAVLYGEESSITLSWEDLVDSIVIEVHHSGDLQQPAPGDSLGAERQELSVALLRSLLHECEFVPEETGGTTIRLTLKR